MKKLFIIKIFLVLAIIYAFMTTVSASDTLNLQNESADTLVRLKLIQGYEDGSLRLQDKIKRSEFIALVVRMAGLDKNTDISGVNIVFKDITSSHWAYNYVKIAIKNKLVNGYPDNTFAPDNFVTYPEAMAVLIRLLGYEGTMSGNWPDNVINLSSQLGINKGLSLPQDRQLTRGETAVLVKNSLSIDLYGL